MAYAIMKKHPLSTTGTSDEDIFRIRFFVKNNDFLFIIVFLYTILNIIVTSIEKWHIIKLKSNFCVKNSLNSS